MTSDTEATAAFHFRRMWAERQTRDGVFAFANGDVYDRRQAGRTSMRQLVEMIRRDRARRA